MRHPNLVYSLLILAYLFIFDSKAIAQPGMPDLNFNSTGFVSFLPPESREATFYAGAVQTDGKIVAAGYLGSFNPLPAGIDFLLVRYNPDGRIDSTFGENGFVTTDLDSTNDVIFSISVQTDGKILTAGRASNLSGSDCALARYLANGALDLSFGIGGKVVLNLSELNDDEINSVLVQPDGKILVAGGFFYINVPNNSADIFIAKLNSNGTLDNTFGIGGVTVTDFEGGFDKATDMQLTMDGKIIVTGATATAPPSMFSDVALLRYTSNGTLDNSFGTGGKVKTAVNSGNDEGRSLVIQPDGKILVGGSSMAIEDESRSYFLLLRYLPTGEFDNTFGTNGIVITDFGPSLDFINKILMQGDKIIAGGSTNVSDQELNLALARYNLNGTLDETFGNHGKVSSDFAGQTGMVSDDVATALAIDNNVLYTIGGRYLRETPSIFIANGIVAAYQLDDTHECAITGLRAYPAVLWPPNHKMRPVEISYKIPGSCLSQVSLDVTKDEQDGLSEADWAIVDKHHILLRAEKNRYGKERTYTITVKVTDENGIVSSAKTSVVVPTSSGRSTDKSVIEERTDPIKENNAEFFLQGNPTRSFFQVHVRNTNLPVNIKVYDVYGRLIESDTHQNNFTFGHNYKPGIYLIVLKGGGRVETVKVIKL